MKNKKPVLVYFSKNDHSDNDITVLKHFTNDFEVVWFYMYESKKRMRLKQEEIIYYANSYGLRLYLVDPKMRYINPLNFFFYLSLIRKINACNPDIVFTCHRDYYFACAVHLLLKCKHFVLGVHDANSHTQSSFRGSLYYLSTLKMLSVANHFVTYSTNQHDVLLRTRSQESCMVGMACKRHGDSSLIQSPLSEGVKLLFFGRIDKYKGLDILIESLENLHSIGLRNYTLTIAGNGAYWPDCEKKIKTTSLYNLKVRFIENAELPDMFTSHHFLCLPYTDATQSGPLVLAIGYELPIIAPNFGCFADTYDEDNAFLYEPNNLERALKKAVCMNQTEYDLMKLACKTLRERYSEETIAQRYIDYFKTIL